MITYQTIDVKRPAIKVRDCNAWIRQVSDCYGAYESMAVNGAAAGSVVVWSGPVSTQIPNELSVCVLQRESGKVC